MISPFNPRRGPYPLSAKPQASSESAAMIEKALWSSNISISDGTNPAFEYASLADKYAALSQADQFVYELR